MPFYPLAALCKLTINHVFTLSNYFTGGIVWWIFRRVWRLSPQDRAALDTEYPALRKRWRWWWWGAELSSLAVGVGSVYALAWPLHGLSQWIRQDDDALFAVLPEALEWALVSIWTGIWLGLYSWRWLARLWGRSNPAGLRRYHQLKLRLRVKAFVRVAGFILLPLSLLIMVHLHRDYSYFYADHLRHSAMFELSEQRLPYQQLTRIERSRYEITLLDDTLARPQVWLRWPNGQGWRSHRDGPRRDTLLAAQIVDFVSRQSGRPIEQVPYLHARSDEPSIGSE